jgi:hypothetical protein
MVWLQKCVLSAQIEGIESRQGDAMSSPQYPGTHSVLLRPYAKPGFERSRRTFAWHMSRLLVSGLATSKSANNNHKPCLREHSYALIYSFLSPSISRTPSLLRPAADLPQVLAWRDELNHRYQRPLSRDMNPDCSASQFTPRNYNLQMTRP